MPKSETRMNGPTNDLKVWLSDCFGLVRTVLGSFGLLCDGFNGDVHFHSTFDIRRVGLGTPPAETFRTSVQGWRPHPVGCTRLATAVSRWEWRRGRCVVRGVLCDVWCFFFFGWWHDEKSGA